MVIFGSLAHASLMFSGAATGSGGGIGTSNIVLTIQNNPVETGCVSWNGTADVTGSAACPQNFATPIALSPVILGGDEKTGSSQTQTRTIATTGVASAASLVILLNVNEPAGNSFEIDNVSLTIFSPTGLVLFNSGNLAGIPLTIDTSQQGQGALGYQLVLDSIDAAAAQAFWGNTANHLGLAATLSGTAGSNETFSIADASATGLAVPAPEPATFGLGAAALALIGFAKSRRS
jgi:hypothetical protein